MLQQAAAEGLPAAGRVVPPLAAHGVRKVYDDGWRQVPVIADLSFTLQAGTIVSVVGPSGCGKTTLLNVLSGLIPPSAGSISWYGQPLRGMPPQVGYMLQKDLLFPWRTALANVMLGLEIKGAARDDAKQRAHVLLDQLGLHGFASHYPATLSGGMRQRVALARTLVNDPQVLLLDEPFAALDFQAKLVIEGDTARLVRSQHRSVLLITHDIEEAVSLSDRVIVLSHRPTRIRSTYDVDLGADRTDMMATRDSKNFTDYVRRIWRDLEVGRG
jgi:NitT/TauT family transport system ATP-binding protein